MNEKLYIPMAIIFAGVLMAFGLYFAYSRAPHNATVVPNTSSSGNILTQANGMKPITTADHILGNPAAQVVIVEYSDTECPFCKDYFSSVQKLMNTYPSGQVAWVYRQFPIASIHSRAPHEAEATECANELGGPDAFWKYTSELYSETTSNDTFDPAGLPVIAQKIGLNVDDFTSCLNSGKYTAQISQDYTDALAAGAQGTPYTVLLTKDGTKLPIQGEESYDDLKASVDLLLK